MGLTVALTPGTKLTTPTAEITPGDLAAGPALPGRTNPGFVGGHAIVTGTRDATGRYARQIFVEPAEHHLIGTVTKNDATGLEVEGMPVILLPTSSAAKPYPDPAATPGMPAVAWDKRLPGTAPKNAAGFEIAPSSIVAGTNIVVAGYYAPDTAGKGVFIAYAATASGDDVSQAPRVSILSAECRQRSSNRLEWDVRGATVPARGTVAILNETGSVQYGSADVSADLSDPGKGQYRFRTEGGNVSQQCPAVVQARYTVDGKAYTATASVERR
jgi:hypothetical protein